MRLYAASMTVEDVERESLSIQQLAEDPNGDWEVVHGLEDDLRREVLTAIACSFLTGTDALRAALACVHLSNFDYPRWCA